MSKKEIEEALEKVMDKNYHEKKNNHEKISIPNDNNNKTKSEEINNYNEDISNYNQETSKVETKKNEQYESKVSELNQKIDDLTETLKRVQADFINYKNRVEKEKAYCIEYGNAELIKKLLPVLDSFDLALQNATDLEKFKKGMEMVYAQLLDVLEHEGLKKIEASGKFDPYKHEVLMKVESDKDEDEIIQELQKGYMLKDKILRHSKVKISSGKKPT